MCPCPLPGSYYSLIQGCFILLCLLLLHPEQSIKTCGLVSKQSSLHLKDSSFQMNFLPQFWGGCEVWVEFVDCRIEHDPVPSSTQWNKNPLKTCLWSVSLSDLQNIQLRYSGPPTRPLPAPKDLVPLSQYLPCIPIYTAHRLPWTRSVITEGSTSSPLQTQGAGQSEFAYISSYQVRLGAGKGMSERKHTWLERCLMLDNISIFPLDLSSQIPLVFKLLPTDFTIIFQVILSPLPISTLKEDTSLTSM